MSTTTHLTEKGPRKCNAKSPESCPVKFNGEKTEHFSSPEEAQQSYEQAMEKKNTSSRLRKRVRKVAVVAGVAAAMASLTACNGVSSVKLPHGSVPTSIAAAKHYGNHHHHHSHYGSSTSSRSSDTSSNSSSGEGDTSGRTGADYTDKGGPTGQVAPVDDTVTQQQLDTAKTELDQLQVRSRKDAAPTKYERIKDFGTPWKDMDNDGCDTRDEILKNQMSNVTYEGNSTCTVHTGTLHDPYTGKIINFVSTNKKAKTGDSGTVQIDHVVPLKNVWESGGYNLTPDQRLQIANDPNNLLAVDGPTNQNIKRDKSADEWTPKGFSCRYGIAQINIKHDYNLSITTPEKSRLRNILANECTVKS